MRELLTCHALIDFLDDYVEERLTPPQRARCDEHLAVCAACLRYQNGYRGTMRLLTLLGLENDADPADVPQQLVEAILSARREARRETRRETRRGESP